MSNLTVEDVKEKIEAKEDVTGLVFVNSKGATGTILAEKSAENKLQATMTCTVENCTETHVRVRSDWFQSYRCRTHSKKTTKSPSGLKLDDGTTIHLMTVLPTDDELTRTTKEKNNLNYEQIKAQRKESSEAERKVKAEEKKAKAEQVKAERAQQTVVEKKAKLDESARKIKEYAERNNMLISAQTAKKLEAEAG